MPCCVFGLFKATCIASFGAAFVEPMICPRRKLELDGWASDLRCWSWLRWSKLNEDGVYEMSNCCDVDRDLRRLQNGCVCTERARDITATGGLHAGCVSAMQQRDT